MYIYIYMFICLYVYIQISFALSGMQAPVRCGSDKEIIEHAGGEATLICARCTPHPTPHTLNP